MGSVAALGFVAPFIYFIFIILSTLRLDFWLSTFTGAVAATQLFCMAMFYHPAADADPELSTITPAAAYRAAACGPGRRHGGAAVCAGSSNTLFPVAAAQARDRITNLFGQHVSPAVVEQLLDAEPGERETPSAGSQ